MNPRLRAQMFEERASALDMAEVVVFNAIRGDPEQGVPPDINSAKWLLERLGAARGYGQKMRLEVFAASLHQLTDTQLERIANGEDVINVFANPYPGTEEQPDGDSQPAAITIDGDFRDAPAAEDGGDEPA